jgi:hypothetical protein
MAEGGLGLAIGRISKRRMTGKSRARGGGGSCETRGADVTGFADQESRTSQVSKSARDQASSGLRGDTSSPWVAQALGARFGGIIGVVPTFLPSSTVVLPFEICRQGCHWLDKCTEDVPDKLGRVLRSVGRETLASLTAVMMGGHTGSYIGNIRNCDGKMR